MTIEDLSKKNKIHSLIAARAFGSGSNGARTKVIYAICSASGYDEFYDFVVNKENVLAALTTVDERVDFYDANREVLINYASKLSEQFYVNEQSMLEGMSYKDGTKVLDNNADVVRAVFLEDDKNHDHYKQLVNVFVENVCKGVGGALYQVLR